ncbi:MAG: amidase [Xanthomonadales bacterium]|nr:amidase [Xanthomonadales bacterium]
MKRNGPRRRKNFTSAILGLCGWLVVAPAGAGPATDATAAALQRIEAWNGQLLAVIATDPTAMAQAAERDRERAGGQLRGPLHGVPVLIKDNIETRDQPTTAGSLALADNHSGRDAPLVAQLREAGLVMVGKANLSEWANFRSERSSSGWSAVGGQARNPHDPARSPCGSSSGSAVAVAAGMVPLAVGTETDGSIVCPAAVNGIVGIKPTVGLVSRRGIVPIAHSQDTAGPMATNMRDATYLLMAMTAHDPADPASPREPGRFGRDYAAALKPEGLRGKRIGVVRSLAGFHEGVDARFEQAISDLRSAGAEIIDQLSFPEEPAGLADAAYEVLLYEFKHDLNAYLAGLPGAAGALRLPDLIEFNLLHAEAEMKWFQQEVFLQAQARGDLQSQAYLDALALTQDYSRGGIDGLLQAHALDLLVSPTDAPAWVIDLVVGDRFLGGSSSMPARAGYPHITVPMGFVHGLPVGLSFYGTAYSEEVLIEAAYAYEQATGHARPPQAFGTWQAAVAPE